MDMVALEGRAMERGGGDTPTPVQELPRGARTLHAVVVVKRALVH